MNRPVISILMAIAIVVCAAVIFLPDYESPRIVKLLILSQVMFALSIGLFLVARHLDFKNKHRRLLLLLVAIALIARLVMVVGAGDKFYISDDVYRYVWDGKVTAHGINPYLYAPLDSRLADLADTVIHPNINFPPLPTIYPPMAQNIFVVSYLIAGDATWGFKLISAVFELLSIFLLSIWLRSFGISRGNLLLWLYSPLILFEFYLSAHVDILGIPFLVGSLIATQRKRPALSGVLLAAATLVKFYGLFLAPFLLLHYQGRDRLRFAIGYVAAFVGLYLPYAIGTGTQVFGSLFSYLAVWKFNASIFFLLMNVVGKVPARIIVAVAFMAWLVWLLFRKTDVLSKMFAAFGGYLVLTTTLFPWYFVWIFPFLLRNLSPAFIFLSGSLLLSYHTFIGYYATGEWSVMIWLGILAYLPFYVLLIGGAVHRKKTRSIYA